MMTIRELGERNIVLTSLREALTHRTGRAAWVAGVLASLAELHAGSTLDGPRRSMRRKPPLEAVTAVIGDLGFPADDHLGVLSQN
jgi:hypothetical protein